MKTNHDGDETESLPRQVIYILAELWRGLREMKLAEWVAILIAGTILIGSGVLIGCLFRLVTM